MQSSSPCPLSRSRPPLVESTFPLGPNRCAEKRSGPTHTATARQSQALFVPIAWWLADTCHQLPSTSAHSPVTGLPERGTTGQATGLVTSPLQPPPPANARPPRSDCRHRPASHRHDTQRGKCLRSWGVFLRPSTRFPLSTPISSPPEGLRA